MSSPDMYAQDSRGGGIDPMNSSMHDISPFPSNTPFSPMRPEYIHKTDAVTSDSSSVDKLDVFSVPKSIKSLFVHSVSRGTRSFVLGYGLRTLFSVVLRVFALVRTNPWDQFDFDKQLGERVVRVRVTAVRLGCSQGLFSFLFRFCNGLLRMLLVKKDVPETPLAPALPRPSSQRRSIASISNSLHSLANKISPVGGTTATEEGPQFWVPEGLITATAGAISGLSILFQPTDVHRTLSLYLFARAVQCGFNHLVKHGMIQPVPYSAEGFFSLASGIIMYCYTQRPDSITPAFFSFISKAGPIDSSVLYSAHMLGQGVSHDGAALRNTVREKYATGMRLFNWRFPNWGSWSARKKNHLHIPLSVPDHVWAESQQALQSRCKPLPPLSTLAYDMDGKPSTPFSTIFSSKLYADGSLYNTKHDYGRSMGQPCSDLPVEDKPILSNLEQYLLQRGLQPCPSINRVAPTAPQNVAKQVLDTKLGAEWSWCVDEIERKKHQDICQGFVELPAAPSTDAGLLPFFEDDRSTTNELTPANKALLVETLLYTHFGSPVNAPTARQVVRAVQDAATTDAERKMLRMPRVSNIALQKQHAEHLAHSLHEKLGLAAPENKLMQSSEARQHLFCPPNSCLAQNHRLPCFLLHPNVPHSCSLNAARVFLETGAKVLPQYTSLSLVPLVVMKNIQLLTNPGILLTTATSILRSCAFLGTFTSVYQSVVCTHRKITATGPESGFALFFAGLCAGLGSILVENETRRTELTLYVLPRAIDCLISLSRNNGYLWGPVLGSLLLENLFIWCSSLGVVTYCFHHQSDTLSRLPKTILQYL